MPSRNSVQRIRLGSAALALCLLSPSAEPTEDGQQVARQAPLVEVLQGGVVVQPVDGVHLLSLAPFVVRVAPGPGRLAVITSASGNALGDARALWSAPLLVPLGSGAASTPLSLSVADDGLEFYEGLSESFLDQWGPVLGVARLADFALLRPTLPRSPHVLMTPRQLTNILRRKDGTQLLPVFRFGTEPIRSAGVESLTLFLLFERAGDPEASWAIIENVETLRLRFHPGEPKSAERLAPYSKVLDCGGSGVVQAVRQNDFQRVERLIQQGVDPNTRSARNNVTLLMCAVSGPDVHSNAVWVLLEAGADVHARTAHGETALMWAARSGERGAFSGSRLNAVEQLLSRGAQVNAADEDGETPLLGAVAMGYAEIAAALLSAGADPAKANRAGETALARAQRLGWSDIAAVIALYP